MLLHGPRSAQVLLQQPDPPGTGLGMQGCGGLHNKASVPIWVQTQGLFQCPGTRTRVLASISLVHGNSPCNAPFLALRDGYTFFQGVLTKAELGSPWNTHKGDPRSGTSMSYWWADHPQPALASPALSSASRCPWASQSLVLPQGEKGILT